jgi:hypothetical protein
MNNKEKYYLTKRALDTITDAYVNHNMTPTTDSQGQHVVDPINRSAGFDHYDGTKANLGAPDLTSAAEQRGALLDSSRMTAMQTQDPDLTPESPTTDLLQAHNQVQEKELAPKSVGDFFQNKRE